MNKFVIVVSVVIFILAALAGYWYLNPHHMPSFIRVNMPHINMPNLKTPSPTSPMKNFRPPQF